MIGTQWQVLLGSRTRCSTFARCVSGVGTFHALVNDPRSLATPNLTREPVNSWQRREMLSSSSVQSLDNRPEAQADAIAPNSVAFHVEHSSNPVHHPDRNFPRLHSDFKEPDGCGREWRVAGNEPLSEHALPCKSVFANRDRQSTSARPGNDRETLVPSFLRRPPFRSISPMDRPDSTLQRRYQVEHTTSQDRPSRARTTTPSAHKDELATTPMRLVTFERTATAVATAMQPHRCRTPQRRVHDDVHTHQAEESIADPFCLFHVKPHGATLCRETDRG